MTVDLNVLNHLGINLYSSIPAVVSEAVANAWDADADSVEINLNKEKEIIEIIDTGHGMAAADVNRKFLTVGYRRRDDGGATSPKGRKVLGRKGIGKLSLFSIADEIEVRTVKDGAESAFLMSLPDIKKAITEGDGKYSPEVLQPSGLDKGTKITLRKLRKKLTWTSEPLRRRLSRRFSLASIGDTFDIFVDGQQVSDSDREYYSKVEFIWTYGEKGNEAATLANGAQEFKRSASFDGWIGTVRTSSDLISEDGDNLNDILIFVRGKLAQENTLQFYGEDGLYASYVVGEVHLDELDDDDKDDIATTSRQALIDDDDRVQKLRSELKSELKHIQSRWTQLRVKEATDTALQVPEVKEWFGTLGPDQKTKAQQLFGKINQLKLDMESKVPLFKFGVLAFEKLKLRDSLDRLNAVAADDIAAYLAAFEDHDELEAQHYFEISKGRLDIIKKFRELTDEDAKEKVLQEFLFGHLWLLEPSWDRATQDAFMETEVKNTVIGAEEFQGEYLDKIGRVDIKYRKSGGEHVIIELKRAGRICDTGELLQQVRKYQRKMKQLLHGLGRQAEPFSIVCVVGRDLSDWSEPEGRSDSRKLLEQVSARVMTYEELIGNSFRAYGEFLNASENAGKIYNVLNAFDKIGS